MFPHRAHHFSATVAFSCYSTLESNTLKKKLLDWNDIAPTVVYGMEVTIGYG